MTCDELTREIGSLRAYRADRELCKVRLHELHQELAMAEQLTGVSSSSQPGESKGSSGNGGSVERIALHLADGVPMTQDGARILREIEALEQRLTALHIKVQRIEAWLMVLDEDDRALVECKLVAGHSWREIRLRTGHNVSALRKQKLRAIQKIQDFLQGHGAATIDG